MTKHGRFLFLLISGCLFGCHPSPRKIPLEILKLETFSVNSSIRALEVKDDSTIWFAGSRGVYGFTKDGGQNWQTDSLKINGFVPNFRSMAVTDSAVFLLSIESPALLYKSTNDGRNWDIVYREDHELVFYDAMTFWNNTEGIAMGDPIGGCLSIIITRDGGNNWNKLDCSLLPPVAEGEAAFAASNSNIAVKDEHAWIVTGGTKARIFHSPDKGFSWEVFDTPIIEGGTMTGIFSTDFWDEKNGILFGGDWEKKEQNTQNKAVTTDGGKTWTLVAENQEPGYRSSVRYVPDGDGKELIAVGIPGISYSRDVGNSWVLLSDESFYTIRFGSNRNIAWLAGNNKIARIVWESK